MAPTGFETPFCAGLSSTHASRGAAWRCFSIFARSAIPTARRVSSDALRPHFMPSMSSHAGPEDAEDARPTGLPKPSITGRSGTRSDPSDRPFGGFQPDLSETRDSGFLFASQESSAQTSPWPQIPCPRLRMTRGRGDACSPCQTIPRALPSRTATRWPYAALQARAERFPLRFDCRSYYGISRTCWHASALYFLSFLLCLTGFSMKSRFRLRSCRCRTSWHLISIWTT